MDRKIFHWPSIIYGPMILSGCILLVAGYFFAGLTQLVIHTENISVKTIVAFVVIWPHLVAVLFLLGLPNKIPRYANISCAVAIILYLISIASERYFLDFNFFRIMSVVGIIGIVVILSLRHGKIFDFEKIAKERVIDPAKKIFVPRKDIMEILVFSVIAWLFYGYLIGAIGIERAGSDIPISVGRFSILMIVDIFVCTLVLYQSCTILVISQYILAFPVQSQEVKEP